MTAAVVAPRENMEKVLVCQIASPEITLWGPSFLDLGLMLCRIPSRELVKSAWGLRPLAILFTPEAWSPGGYEACRRLKSDPRTRDIPVLMVSADARPAAALAAYAAGADDFLARDGDPRVLAAHVLACARRYGRRGCEPHRAGPFTVDAGNFSASFKGRPLQLTPAEFGLLESLVRRPGTIVRREGRLSHIVETHVCNLRRKLGPDGRRLIATVAGVGYRLDLRP